MLVRRLSLIFCIQSVGILVWANCPTYDLSKSAGFAERAQIYQGDIGWCFAYSHADIVSQKLKVAVSPFDIAIRTFNKLGVKNFDLNYKNIEGGSVVTLAEMAAEEPFYCTEGNYASEEVLPSIPVMEVYSSVVLLKRNEPLRNLKNTANFFQNISNVGNLISDEVSRGKTNFEVMKTLNESNCRNRVKAQLEFETKSLTSGWNDQDAHEIAQSYIAEQLKDGKLVSAGVDSTILYKSSIGLFKRIRANLVGNHQITVRGMGEEGGQCYFSVRDSAMRSKEECEKEKLVKNIICEENQNYKVPANEFLNALKATTVVK